MIERDKDTGQFKSSEEGTLIDTTVEELTDNPKEETSKVNPNELLLDFLQRNKLSLEVVLHNRGVTMLNDGLVVTDKPLPKIKAVYVS